jgi:hypothetical protein
MLLTQVPFFRGFGRKRLPCPPAPLRTRPGVEQTKALANFCDTRVPVAIMTEGEDRAGYDRLVHSGTAEVRTTYVPVSRPRLGLADLLGLTQRSSTVLRLYARPCDSWRLDHVASIYEQCANRAMSDYDRALVQWLLHQAGELRDYCDYVACDATHYLRNSTRWPR